MSLTREVPLPPDPTPPQRVAMSILCVMRDRNLSVCDAAEAAGVLWGILRRIAVLEGSEGHLVEHYQDGLDDGRALVDAGQAVDD